MKTAIATLVALGLSLTAVAPASAFFTKPSDATKKILDQNVLQQK